MEAAGVTTVKSPGDLGAAIAKRLWMVAVRVLAHRAWPSQRFREAARER